MSEKLIELLMSWGINERLATSQVEYLQDIRSPLPSGRLSILRCWRRSLPM